MGFSQRVHKVSREDGESFSVGLREGDIVAIYPWSDGLHMKKYLASRHLPLKLDNTPHHWEHLTTRRHPQTMNYM